MVSDFKATLAAKNPCFHSCGCLHGALYSIEITFPHDRHPPSPRPQLYDCGLIPLYVGVEFLLPELGARCWGCRRMTTRVSVPKAPMHKHYSPMARQN